MTREEVYEKCTEKIRQPGFLSFRQVGGETVLEAADGDTWLSRTLLPKEAIDAIIDCAVEEAIKALNDDDKQWQVIDMMLDQLIQTLRGDADEV